MSVNSEVYSAGPYVTDGTQREFPFDFPVLSPDHVAVYLDDELCRLDYAVDVTPNGGTVAFAVAPQKNLKITILRDIPLTQLTDLETAAAFYPKVIERALDKLTMIAQSLKEEVGRSLRLPPSVVSEDGEAITGEEYMKRILAEIAGVESIAKEFDSLKEWVSEHAGERLQANYVEVTSLDANGDLYVDNDSIPVLVQTNKGGCYPIEKGTLTDHGTHYSIDPAAYLAYDGESTFTPPWRVWRAGGKAGSAGRGIFEVFYSLSATPPSGAMDLSLGTQIDNCKQLYPDFFAEAVKRANGGNLRVVSAMDYASELAEYGSCGAFVIDEAKGSLRLPTIKGGIVSGEPGAIVEDAAGGNQAAVGAKLYIQVFNAAPEVSLAQSANFTGMVEKLSQEVSSLRSQVETLLETGIGSSGEGTPPPANPTGTMIMFMGAVAPLGYILCDGRALSRKAYASLFAVIGTLYGEGDGVNTFNVPDMRAVFPQGGSSAQLGTKKSAGLPDITAVFPVMYDASANGANDFRGSTTPSPDYRYGIDLTNSHIQYRLALFEAHRSSSVYGNSSTVQPPALIVNYYIKY